MFDLTALSVPYAHMLSGDAGSGGQQLPRAKYVPRATLRWWLANSSFVRHDLAMPESSRR
jgi:hypothetical protein